MSIFVQFFFVSLYTLFSYFRMSFDATILVSDFNLASICRFYSFSHHSMGTPSPRLTKEIGPWSEQFSSSGKRYYYNRETEVSQWEKPVEWKQAERDHAEQRVRSSTTSAKEDKNNSSSYSKPRHRPPVSSLSSTNVPAHPSSSVSKPAADSSTGPAVRSSASSPSVIHSSTAPPKRPRLDEQLMPPSFSSSVTRQISSSSASNKKVPSSSTTAISTAAAVPSVSSSTDHYPQRCASVSSSSPVAVPNHHRTPPISSSTTISKRPSFSGPAPNTEDDNGLSKQCNSSLRPASKSASTPTVIEETKKGGQTPAVENHAKGGHHQTAHIPKLSSVKSSLSASEIHRSGSTSSRTAAYDFDHSEKQSHVAPRDDMHTKFYRPEPGALAARRALLGGEEFLNNVKRCADRKLKHATILQSIDRDLHSIQTLTKMGEFRAQLLKQRTMATSKRINELESKGQ